MLVPPGTPRFPYTTLFRSLPDAVGGAPGRGEEERRGAQRVRAGARSAGAREEGLHRRRRLPAAGCSDDEEDRKSTRLNSSHVALSYAVFCLKKKKHTEREY